MNMSNRLPTLLDNRIYPIHYSPLEFAISVTYDSSLDCCWVYVEKTAQGVVPISISTLTSWDKAHYRGVRLIVENGFEYVALSWDFRQDSHIDAYDRAMSVV